MKTVVVNIQKKDERFFLEFLKKIKVKARVLTEAEREEMAMAKWIDEGMKTEDVSEKKIFSLLKKRGVKI